MITLTVGLLVLVATNVAVIVFAGSRVQQASMTRVANVLGIFNVGALLLLASLVRGGAP